MRVESLTKHRSCNLKICVPICNPPLSTNYTSASESPDYWLLSLEKEGIGERVSLSYLLLFPLILPVFGLWACQLTHCDHPCNIWNRTELEPLSDFSLLLDVNYPYLGYPRNSLSHNTNNFNTLCWIFNLNLIIQIRAII